MYYDSIIGHEFVKKQIKNSIESGRFAHAHLIVGEDGIGKSVIAKAAAFHLLSKKENKSYADIVEVNKENDVRSIGIKDVLKVIEEVNKKPFEGDKKVIIIYKAHLMTEQAQNAFLKTVEEPPLGIYIMFLCENIEDILPTIKSRCQVHLLKRLNDHDMLRFIELKHPECSKKELSTVLSFSDGIPGRAERFFNDDEFAAMRNEAQKFIEDAGRKETDKIMDYENVLLKHKNEWKDIFTCMLSYIRDAIVYRETGNSKFIINADKYDFIENMSRKYSFKKLNNVFNIISNTGSMLKKNVDMSLAVYVMLLKIWEG